MKNIIYLILVLDSPIYMSWPHFLHGERELVDGVEGLRPDPEKHSFILDLNPVSIRRLIVSFLQK